MPSSKETLTPEVEPLTSLLLHPLLQDPKFLAAVGGVVILLLVYTFLKPTAKATRGSGVPTVLLIGPSDAGKTSLFAKLAHGTYPQTHTSIEASTTTFSLTFSDQPGSKPIRLIDLPGHPRLKDEFKKHVKDVSAVVFVVDVVGIVRNSASVAETIPPILTSIASHSIRSGHTTKFLFLANKTDLLIRPTPPQTPSPPNIPAQTLTTAHERLRSILTREMDRLKSARGSGGVGGRIEGMSKVSGGSRGSFWSRLFGSTVGVTLAGEGEGEGEEDESLVWGGKGPFRWEDVEGVEFEWGASGLGMVRFGKEAEKVEEEEEGDGLDELKRFLRDI